MVSPLISAVGECLRAVPGLCLSLKSMCNLTPLSGNLPRLWEKCSPVPNHLLHRETISHTIQMLLTFPISNLCALRWGLDRDRCSYCVG